MSSQSTQLTIAIPSWNRITRLLVTLVSICNQPESGQVNLLILDNGSDQDYTPALNFLREKKQPFRYVRHKQNIGMCSNILRCVEESETEWVWILGDDDPVEGDSLARVLNAINQNNSTDILCFYEGCRTSGVSSNSSLELDFQEYLDTQDSLKAISGISENIFRRQPFVAHLSHGFHYSTTLFPHLVVTLAIMSSGGRISFERSSLLQKNSIEAEDRWYWPSWDLGVGLLLDLPFLNSGERKKIRHKLTELISKKSLLIHSVAMLAAGFDRPYVMYVYIQGSLRGFGLVRTLFSPYTYCMLMAISAPKLANSLLSFAYRLARKTIPFSYYADAMKSTRIN